jgi:hypothetical protein
MNGRKFALAAVLALAVCLAVGSVASQALAGSSAHSAKKCKKHRKKKCSKPKTSQPVQGAPGAQGPAGATGSQGAPGVNALSLVSSLSSDQFAPAPAWGARSSTCGAGAPGAVAVADGHAKFGPYSNGDQSSAITYNGVDGKQLRDVSEVTYNAFYQQAADQHGGTPYFRIFTEGGAPATPNDLSDDHSIIFSPNTQTGAPGIINSGEWRKWSVTAGGVRYDDDAGNNPDISWNALISGHGTDVITQIRVQAGCAGAYSNGETAYADDVSITVQGERTEFNFG